MDRGIQKGATRRDFRRIGRKALASGRTLALLEARNPAPRSRVNRHTFKRWHLAVPGVVIIILGGFWGVQSYAQVQRVAREKAATDALTEKARAVSKQEEECRQARVKENAANVSTMTYDQLYGKSCDY